MNNNLIPDEDWDHYSGLPNPRWYEKITKKDMNKEGYIYLGEYYDITGRPMDLSDKKIGLSIDPIKREYQLNRTKSPIGYRVISCYKVDDAYKVEKMLHSILDSRRVEGEWFNDDEDTLTGEFINFMVAYGGEFYDIGLEKEKTEPSIDDRLLKLSNEFGKDTILIRRYKGVDYEVKLDTSGLLHFKGEVFDTPNKLYNNGIVKHVKGKRGNSGTNGLSQFIIKETGERLQD